MENSEENKQKEGVVPKEEISGSDADKAYAEDGAVESSSADQKEDGTEGSDADTDEEA